MKPHHAPARAADGRIRVLFVASGLAVEGAVGGAARFVTELARALDRTTFAPAIIALWDYGTEGEQQRVAALRAEGIPATLAAPWQPGAPLESCLCSLRALWDRADEFHSDIIHSHGEFSDVTTVLLRRRLGIPHAVRTFHNVVEWPKRPRLGAFLANAVYPLAYEAEVGVSQRAYESLRVRPLARLLGRRSERIYNAVDLARFALGDAEREAARAAVRKEWNFAPSDFLIGSYGRLVRLKGYHHLLDAAATVLALAPQARLVVAGDGPERGALEAQAAQLGLGDRVIFAGFRRDVERILLAFDLFVSPSLIEGLPTSVMEAMASGVPVVATSIPGNAELIRHGESGVLAPPADPPALAQALLASLQGATRAQEMAAAARRDVAARFAIGPVARAYEQLYRALADGSLA